MEKRALFFKRVISSQRGGLLIISLLVILLMLGIGAGLLLLVTNELRLAERQRLSTSSFDISEAGLERAIYDLRSDFESDSSDHPWMSGQINSIDVAFTNTTDYEVLHQNISFSDGFYTVSLKKASDDELWVKSVGTFGDATSTIEAYVKIVDFNPWNYAIFAGKGQTGNLIKGNVDIRGSVLILGEGLTPGDYAVDIGGTAEFVGNNYRTLDPTLKARVPALDTVVYNGETVETLHSVLRVKNGIVGVSGSSSVGEADLAANAYKETVDGVFVTDGWGGNQGVVSVYSDNGTDQAYDMGDSMTFPSLSDPYTDSLGNNYSSYQAYLKTNGYTLSTDDVTNLNALSGTPFSFGNSNGSVMWDGAGNMTIDGILYLDNGASLEWLNKEVPVNYSGKGSFLVTGDVKLATNVLTVGNVSFPSNIMGIMTPNNIYLGANSQRDIMGMFYAETSVRVDKQTDVVGSLVSNYYDFGTNVPALYQVPDAASSLPTGMIGGSARWFTVQAWIKR